ncbi:MAG: IS110 family transposase [Syntrophales bacterium]
MKKVANFSKKVKGQMRETVLDKASWVIGIDIGKEKLSCALMDINKTLICRFEIEGSLAGYNDLLNRVKRETKGNGKAVFALEPTGHYWMVLGQFFEDHNQSYVLIHPLVVARSREVNRLNKGKTDPLDARLIGELACDGSITRTQIPADYWATIRVYAREYMDREKDIVREKNRIGSYLETTLPEFVDIFPNPLCVTGRACIRALAHFREASKRDWGHFEKHVRSQFSGKRLVTSRIRRLHEMLQRGDAPGLRAGRQAMCHRVINCLDRLEIYERQQETAKQALVDSYEKSEYKQYLDSIWGTNATANALVLGFMGDPAVYDSPASLVKLAGSDPIPDESGKFKGKTSISHRGRSLLRKAGDRVSFMLEKRNSVFRAFVNHLMSRQKNRLTKRQARIACINKYFRIVWVLCNHRVPFNPALAQTI